jgi:hypothetical protein
LDGAQPIQGNGRSPAVTFRTWDGATCSVEVASYALNLSSTR